MHNLNAIAALREQKQTPGDAMTALFDKAEWDAMIGQETKNTLGGMIIEGGVLGAKKIGMEIALDLTNPKVGERLEKYSFHFAKKIDQTTYDKLTGTLVEGLNAGEDVRKLQKRVADIPQFKDRAYSEMVARTESARAQNAGTQEVWRQSGVVEGKEWLTAPDACAWCNEMNGKIVGLEEVYWAEGTAMALDDGRAMKFGYEDVGYPPLHPHCFIHHSVKIITENGVKNINKIQVGDKVLTHRGRFRSVTRILGDTGRYYGDVIRIRYKGRVFGLTNQRNSITVTPEHPILTNRGWVMAEDVTVKDSIFVLAQPCEACGTLTPHWKKYCSPDCQMQVPSTRRAISLGKQGAKNWMYGRTGKRHHLWKGGKVWYRGKEWKKTKLKVRMRDGFVCQECGMTEAEHKERYSKQPLQVHHIDPYRFSKNNNLDNLITLCVICHKAVEWTDNPAIMASGGAQFLGVPILEIRREYMEGERLYNFAVEEDESYVANGIVSHNCRCAIVAVLIEKMVEAAPAERTLEEINAELKEKTGYTFKGFKESERELCNDIAQTIQNEFAKRGKPFKITEKAPKIIADRSSGFGRLLAERGGGIKIRIPRGATHEQISNLYRPMPKWTLGKGDISGIDQIKQSILHEIGHHWQPRNARDVTAKAWLDLQEKLKSGALKYNDFGDYVAEAESTGHGPSEAWAELWGANAFGRKLPAKLSKFVKAHKNVFNPV